PPQDVVLVAAETTSEVTSLRGTTEVDPRDGGHRSATIEVSGADSAIVTRDGDVTVTSVVVGDTFYERASDDPNPRTGKAEPAGRLAPFASSTGAVVRAALQGAEVDDRGEEKVRGATTTHYRLTMTAAARKALGALSPGQTAWFELEYPDEVSTIDIWAAGDLIRRITVQQESQRSTTEFYDFNQPITIAVPPGF
ncbi:hypothetical protein, partial [Actinoplanes sp. RD1]|uniref:hypothetical protein n=1 Tax=Actinoplanes sp. RD1 TaxID=3064538 RepID=UPI002742415C